MNDLADKERAGISDQLEKDVPFMVTVHFGKGWCDTFFKLTEDVNDSLHTETGQNIVQGAAIFAKIGTLMSIHMKGYLVHQVNQLIFKKPVRVGESVYVIMRRFGRGKAANTVTVTVQNHCSEEICTAEVVLVSEKIFARNNRPKSTAS